MGLGDRNPASIIAVLSSSCVGSLIGDLARSWFAVDLVGEGRSHNAAAFLTDTGEALLTDLLDPRSVAGSTGLVIDGSSPSVFAIVKGDGRLLVGSVECVAKGPDFSLDEKEGDLIVVLGFGLGGEETLVSDFASSRFTGVSREADLPGDRGLDGSSLDSGFFRSGASCRNCERRFISSLRGDTGCDIRSSLSACGFGDSI